MFVPMWIVWIAVAVVAVPVLGFVLNVFAILWALAEDGKRNRASAEMGRLARHAMGKAPK